MVNGKNMEYSPNRTAEIMDLVESLSDPDAMPAQKAMAISNFTKILEFYVLWMIDPETGMTKHLRRCALCNGKYPFLCLCLLLLLCY